MVEDTRNKKCKCVGIYVHTLIHICMNIHAQEYFLRAKGTLLRKASSKFNGKH